MTDDINNVIATASLLLAVASALFSIWYSEVTLALNEAEPRLPAERKTLLKRLAPIFWSKSFPLAIGTCMITTVFAPRLIFVVSSSLSLRGKNWQYDDMKAAFVATELMLIALAIVAVVIAFRLGKKCWGLR